MLKEMLGIMGQSLVGGGDVEIFAVCGPSLLFTVARERHHQHRASDRETIDTALWNLGAE